MSESLITHESVMFTGPRSPLVGTLAYGEGATRGSVLLAGPHPYMGGTMNNNVVARLADGLAMLGYATLCFDYHAVNADTVAESMVDFWATGHTPQDAELIEEARCAQLWLQEQLHTGVHLVGYSFGCEVISEIIDHATVSATVIAPTVKVHELAGIRDAAVPKLLLYSNDDFATAQLATESWFASVAGPKRKHCFIGADHFFKGIEDRMIGHVSDHISASDTSDALEVG